MYSVSVRIKLTGFNDYFVSKISDNLHYFNLDTTKKDSFDLELIIDPHLNSIKNPEKTIIALVEPQVVRPDLYNKATWRKYAGILPLSYYRAQRLGLNEWFDFPVTLPTYLRNNHMRVNRIAIVNEHKFSGSSRSMYGLRRKVIRYFEANYPGKLDVYGVEWGKGRVIELQRRIFSMRQHLLKPEFSLEESFSDLWHKYGNIAGHMHEDLEKLQEYESSIVIENDLDYISEKVWKSIYAGAVPIYVGPKLTNDPMLEAVVQTANPEVFSIVSNVSALSTNLKYEIRKKGYDLLDNIEDSKYGINLCAKKVAESIHKLILKL
jgi:hypothetical protein